MQREGTSEAWNVISIPRRTGSAIGRGERAPRVPLACVTCPYGEVTGKRRGSNRR